MLYNAYNAYNYSAYRVVMLDFYGSSYFCCLNYKIYHSKYLQFGYYIKVIVAVFICSKHLE